MRKFPKLARKLGIERLSIKIHVEHFAQVYSNSWWENPNQITTDIRNALNCFSPLGVLTGGLSIEVELPTSEPALRWIFDVRKYKLPQNMKRKYETHLSQPRPGPRRSSRASGKRRPETAPAGDKILKKECISDLMHQNGVNVKHETDSNSKE